MASRNNRTRSDDGAPEVSLSDRIAQHVSSPGPETLTTVEGSTDGIKENTNGGASAQPTANGTQSTGETGTTGQAAPNGDASPQGAAGPTVDPNTGEMSGAGFESQETPMIDPITMLTKIVAKDIVGRSELKCTKTWKQYFDPKGNPVTDKDGNPQGEWEVTPPRPLYVVFGTTNGTRTGTSQFGDWVAFTGVFEAVRHIDGARFASNEVILQEPANTLLLGQLQGVKQRDPGGSVGFSFEIGVQTSEQWVASGQGSSYKFTIKSIFNISRHDPLAAMRQSLLPHLPKPPPKQLTQG